MFRAKPLVRHVLFTLVAALFVPAAASAGPITLSASGAGGRSASVTFATSGLDLIITLTNTATYDSAVPTDILTGVFFDITNNLALSAQSAILGSGSTVKGNGGLTDAGGGVGGEWAYKSNLAGAPGGALQGISSAGLGLFGPGDRFAGSNLQGPTSPDGIQYGITTLNDTAGNDNGGISGVGLIRNSVVFTLSGLWLGFDPSAALSNVTFQYGTALTEPSISVPEPASLLFLGVGLAGFGYVNRRRYRSRKA